MNHIAIDFSYHFVNALAIIELYVIPVYDWAFVKLHVMDFKPIRE